MNIYNCDNVDLDNVKIFTAWPNGDGITVQSSRDVTVRNSFIRSWDDSLVVKNYASEKGSDLARVTFGNCQVWTDLEKSAEVGYETNKGCKPKATISDVAFRNITVLHNFHKPVMCIHNTDDCEVSGIRYQNIVVEEASMDKGEPVTDENVRENQSTSIDKNTANVRFTNTGPLPEALDGLSDAAE